MIFRILFLIPLCLIISLGVGCLSLKPENELTGESRILLSTEAAKLRGIPLKNIVVERKDAIADVPLTTRLIRNIVDQTRSAVVSIYVKTQTPYRLKLIPFSPLGGIRVTVPGIGLGSGFFIHADGYLLTNNHVIEHADQIHIRTIEGKDYEVYVIARDRAYDLALMKVKSAPEESFSVLPMGQSNLIGTGDQVIAVGNPLGLGHTVTTGIISQTGRDLTGKPEKTERHIEYIQTDSAINPGSSGGPLITLDGRWVAVNTAAITQAQGLGFAVPSNQVRSFLEAVTSGKGDPEER